MRSRIIGCQSQMKFLKFFYCMHLSCKLHFATANLSKSLHKEIIFSTVGARIAQLSIWKRNDFENLSKYAIRWDILFVLWCVSVKALSANSFWTQLYRKSEKNVTINRLIAVSKQMKNQWDQNDIIRIYQRMILRYFGNYFKTLDLIISVIRTRFDSFIAFFLI